MRLYNYILLEAYIKKWSNDNLLKIVITNEQASHCANDAAILRHVSKHDKILQYQLNNTVFYSIK